MLNRTKILLIVMLIARLVLTWSKTGPAAAHNRAGRRHLRA